MSFLPSLAHLRLPCPTSTKRAFDEVGGEEEEEEEEQNFEYEFTYADGCVIRYRVEISEFGVTLGMIGEGSFDLGIELPFHDGAAMVNQSRVWKQERQCPKTIPRAIHAVCYILRESFPAMTSLTYRDTAILEEWQLRHYAAAKENGLSRREAIRKVVEDMYWRVKYYEGLGFDFNRTYDDIVNETVDYLVEQRGNLDAAAKRSDFDGEEFEGDLFEIARSFNGTFVSVEKTMV